VLDNYPLLNTRFTTRLATLVLAITLLCLDACPASGQELQYNPRHRGSWFSAGLGGGNFAYAAGATLSARRDGKLVTLRCMWNSQTRFFDFPEETVWDVGLLAGLIRPGSRITISLSAGIAVVGGSRLGRQLPGYLFPKYEEDEFTTVGMPLEIQVTSLPESRLSGSLHLFANLNPERSFLGALVCVRFGKPVYTGRTDPEESEAARRYHP